MTSKNQPIIPIGIGTEEISSNDELQITVNDIYSIEPASSNTLLASKKLGTLGKDFNAYSNSNSKGLIHGVGLAAVAVQKGVERNETVAKLFLHGNYAENSMQDNLSKATPITEDERLDIAYALDDYSENDIRKQMVAQDSNYDKMPDFEPDERYDNKDVYSFLEEGEVENIAEGLDNDL